jgi:ankyrin repeat protein
MVAIDCNFSISAIKKLLEAGCKVNAQGDDGMTPLHKAFYLENLETF